MQAYRHTGDALARSIAVKGCGGFIKGLQPSLFGVSHVAVQFPLYESFKNLAGMGGGRVGSEYDPACSSTAKMIASVTTYPHEVLRTRLQMQPRHKPHHHLQRQQQRQDQQHRRWQKRRQA